MDDTVNDETTPDAAEKPTFHFSTTKVIAAQVLRIYDACSSANTRRLWLHAPGIVTRRATPRKSMRLIWNDGSSVLMSFAGQSGGRCLVTVEHTNIQTAARAEAIQELWAAALQRLKNRMER